MADPRVLYVISGGEAISPDSDDYYNINTLQRALNSLKVVSNGAAKTLISQAKTALDKAALKSITVKSLVPGAVDAHDIIVKDVAKVRGKLDWHRNEIRGSYTLIYDHPDDLKKWILEAYFTYNKAHEGKRTEDDISFYKEAIRQIAYLYTETKKAVDKGSSWVGTALVLGGIGAVAYGIWSYKMESMKTRRLVG